MSKGFRDLEAWAKNFIERYDTLMKQSSTNAIATDNWGYQHELYKLAKAILADLESRGAEKE